MVATPTDAIKSFLDLLGWRMPTSKHACIRISRRQSRRTLALLAIIVDWRDGALDFEMAECCARGRSRARADRCAYRTSGTRERRLAAALPSRDGVHRGDLHGPLRGAPARAGRARLAHALPAVRASKAGSVRSRIARGCAPASVHQSARSGERVPERGQAFVRGERVVSCLPGRARHALPLRRHVRAQALQRRQAAPLVAYCTAAILTLGATKRPSTIPSSIGVQASSRKQGSIRGA